LPENVINIAFLGMIMAKRAKKKGLPPGTIVHTGEAKGGKARVTVIDYDEKGVKEKDVEDAGECFEFRGNKRTTWINIDGVHDVALIKKLGEHFGVHPLVLEDIANIEQRPKVEEFKDYLFIVAKMFYSGQKEGEVDSEQISFILGKDFIISLQESKGDVFEPVRERIRKGRGILRGAGADYLLYALLDAIVDNYFVILEGIGERIEELEEELTENPTNKTLQQLHALKRDMIYIRKGIWPLREVISALSKSDLRLVKKKTRRYLRDVYEHTIQVIDTIEAYRDILSGMVDLYLSSISNKMNEIMKVLTIIATIFIPLTFITGIYGMNFENMPEIGWVHGYPFALGIMLLVALIMFIYFKSRKWI
jgi:magnesium transporter